MKLGISEDFKDTLSNALNNWPDKAVVIYDFLAVNIPRSFQLIGFAHKTFYEFYLTGPKGYGYELLIQESRISSNNSSTLKGVSTEEKSDVLIISRNRPNKSLFMNLNILGVNGCQSMVNHIRQSNMESDKLNDARIVTPLTTSRSTTTESIKINESEPATSHVAEESFTIDGKVGAYTDEDASTYLTSYGSAEMYETPTGTIDATDESKEELTFDNDVTVDETITQSSFNPNVTEQETEIISEEPTIITEEPTIVTEEPTIVTEDSTIVTEEPTIITEEPTIMSEEPKFMVDEANIINEEANLINQEAHLINQEENIINQGANFMNENSMLNKSIEGGNEHTNDRNYNINGGKARKYFTGINKDSKYPQRENNGPSSISSLSPNIIVDSTKVTNLSMVKGGKVSKVVDSGRQITVLESKKAEGEDEENKNEDTNETNSENNPNNDETKSGYGDTATLVDNVPLKEKDPFESLPSELSEALTPEISNECTSTFADDSLVSNEMFNTSDTPASLIACLESSAINDDSTIPGGVFSTGDPLFNQHQKFETKLSSSSSSTSTSTSSDSQSSSQDCLSLDETSANMEYKSTVEDSNKETSDDDVDDKETSQLSQTDELKKVSEEINKQLEDNIPD